MVTKQKVAMPNASTLEVRIEPRSSSIVLTLTVPMASWTAWKCEGSGGGLKKKEVGHR